MGEGVTAELIEKRERRNRREKRKEKGREGRRHRGRKRRTPSTFEITHHKNLTFTSTCFFEVGLRVLLSPLGSSVVYRTACCSIGVVLPVYSTFKAIETKKQNEQQRWLVYWAAYGSFIVAEAFTDKLISWFPIYYHLKFAFLLWLQLPTVDGANQLYVNFLRPFLLRHQPRLDQIVGVLYCEMTKFLNVHQEKMQFAKKMITKLFSSAKQAFGETDTSHTVPRRADHAIEGPTNVESNPENSE